jgi:hypothetical protein
MNPGYILDKFGMLDKFGIYPGFIWDTSRKYPGFIYISDKSTIYPKYIPEYIPDIFRIYSQIYLGFQGWGVPSGRIWCFKLLLISNVASYIVCLTIALAFSFPISRFAAPTATRMPAVAVYKWRLVRKR